MPRAAQIRRRVHPGVEILAAVAGRGVHETGAGVVGDVVAGEHRHGELVAAAKTVEWMRKRKCCPSSSADDIAKTTHRDFGLACATPRRQRVGEDQLLAWLRAEIILGRGNLVEAVVDARRIVDRAVAGDGPWRGRPDNDDRQPSCRCVEASQSNRPASPPIGVTRRSRPETSPRSCRSRNPGTRPRPRPARCARPRSTSPASSRDKAGRDMANFNSSPAMRASAWKFIVVYGLSKSPIDAEPLELVAPAP